MAITESPLFAGRSPLRAHLPRGQQPSISNATSARLRHLQQVASWASLVVPPLGAFLGSHLASTSEMLGCPPPASHHFTCQRCESVLHVGINCSFRIKSKKKLKKRRAVTKGVATPINTFVYSCQHCAFESVMPGTSKAYVKIKLSERAAHHKLSEPHQGLSEFVTENITQPIKAVSNSIVPSSSLSKESPGSTSKTPGSAAKRTRRKGWQSLKQLCSSPADFSPAGSKSASSMKSASPFLPQSKNLDIARVMPTVLQAGLKYSTPTSEIGGEFCIKTKSMLELSEGDAGPDRILNLSNSSGVAATGLRSDTEIAILNSKRVDKFICSEKKVAHTENLLQLSDASRIAMIVEDSVLKQKSIIHHTNADAAMLKRLSTPVSASKHSARDTISATETQFNLPCIASLSDSANVAPISNSQGLRTSEDETCNSNSAANFVEDSSIPVMVKSSDEQEKSSPIDKDVITKNSSLIKAVLQKRRQHDDEDNGCNVPPEADEASLHDWDLYLQQTSSIDPSSIKKNVNARISACERKASRPRAKKKPLFRRFGHHWFTICKSSKRLNWRII